MDSGSPPQPQNAGVATNLAQQYNTGAATQSQQGSMVNQVNPYGKLTYNQNIDPTTGKPVTGPGANTATVQLSPAQQQLLDTLQKTQYDALLGGQGLIKGANYGTQSPTDVIGNATTGLTQDYMNKQYAYLNPLLKMQTDQRDTALRNQGIMPGTPAYTNAMRDVQDTQTRDVGQILSSFEPQAFQQASSLYQMPAILGGAVTALGQPGSVNQSLVQTPQLNIQPADYLGALANQQNIQEQNYQAQIAQQDAMMGALGQIGAAGLTGGLGGFPNSAIGGLFKKISDRRLKRNIKQIGEWINGLPIYRFSYKWSNTVHIGFMADEVEKLHPEAVFEINGYRAVNYPLAMV